MRSAANLEDTTEKHPVTPGAIVPARELLGDLLLIMLRPHQALPEFEASLKFAPNRFNGVFGAARAAELDGNTKKAAQYYKQLADLGWHNDVIRPAMRNAHNFIAASGAPLP